MTKPTKVIAIDPGPMESAVVIWDGERISNAAISTNDLLRDAIQAWGMAHGRSRITQLAIEMVASYGMPVGKEIFETVLWIGRFVEIWAATAFVEPVLVYRSGVKLYHCGNLRAKDSNVRQALMDKYGKPGTKKKPGATYGLKKDLWSAFAIATYFLDNNKA